MEDSITQAKRDFERLVTALNTANADKEAWWLTSLSCRDRVHGRLMDRLARFHGIETSAVPGRLADLHHFAKVVARELRRWLAARRYRKKSKERYDVVLVTILNGTRLAATGRYRDDYFGDLPAQIAERGKRVLVAGFTQGNDWSATAAATNPNATGPTSFQTFAHHIGLFDIISGAASAFLSRFDLDLKGQDAVYKRLVSDEMLHQRAAIFEGSLIRKAMAEILASNPDARVLHMFENNAWERGSYLAARDTDRQRDLVGYLHCAVLQSHRKFYFPTEEHHVRPGPHQVVATGRLAAQALETISPYPDGMLRHDGVALRDNLALADPELIEAGPLTTILVLLEGLNSVEPLVRTALEVARRNRSIRFEMRCHPQLPYDVVLSLLGAERDDARGLLMESKAQDLQSAVMTSDLVAYSSSTAVFTALALCKPVIHVPTDAFYDNDPLFMVKDVVMKAQNADQFQECVSSLQRAGRDVLIQRAKAGQAFLLDAMTPPNDKTLDLFCV